MKKMTIIILIMFFTLRAFCPDNHIAYLMQDSGINPFMPLIKAIGMVESSHDTLAYNSIEQAAGYFQIRPIRIEDYNKRTGSSYTTRDMFDYYKAEKVFLYYASQIGPYDLEQIAKRWNGSGKKTITYWCKVQKVLLSSL